MPTDEESITEAEREALVTIARGAVVTSSGVSTQRLLSTALEVVLARGLGPVAYGVYALAWRIAQLLAYLVPFGTVATLQRYLPEYADSPNRRSQVVGLSYATTGLFSVGIALGVWYATPLINELTLSEPTFLPAMRAFGFLVGMLGVITVAAANFRAVGSARGEVVLNKLLRPGVRLIGAFTAIGLGYGVVGVVGAIVVCTGLLAVSAVPLTARATDIRPSLRGTAGEVKRFYNHAAPVAMSSIGKIFQNRVDVLLIGLFLTAVAAGVYNAVLVLVAIAWIPLLSFNQLLPPVASDLYANDEVEALNAVYSSITRLIVTTVVPILGVLLVFGHDLLGVFGATYTRGYLPLAVYLGGVFVGSAVGATGWLLMMTDHQYVRMVLDWMLAILNVTLTYVFIREFGLVGAALGTSLAIAVQNSIQVLLLRHYEGLWPFDRTFLTPLAAGGVMLAAMWTVRVVLQGWLGVGIGSIGGIVAYVGALLALGIDSRDRLVVRELAATYLPG